MRSPIDSVEFFRPLAYLSTVLAILAFGCDVGQQPSYRAAATDPTLNVNVIEVAKDENPFKSFIVFGKLKAARQSQLGFGRGGSVKAVLKQLGDRLNAGDKLAELENAQLENQRQTTEQKLSRLKSDSQASRGTASSSLSQQVKQVEEELTALELELANSIIVAPYPSLIVQRNVEVGSLVSPATAAFQIIEDAPPLVEASLPTSTAAMVNVGRSIYVKVGDQNAIAKLKAKSPLQDPTASQRVLFEFSEDLPANSWAYGQVVEIRVLVRTNVAGFWLPLSALQHQANGLWSALVVVSAEDPNNSDFRIERRVLEILQLEDEFALIQGSLNDGDRVVVNGTHRIVPGQTVNPVNVSGEFKQPFEAETTE